MKASYWIAFGLGAGVCVGLSACGGQDNGSMMMQSPAPSQPQTTMLSVNDVLTKAQTESEMDDPFKVNDGAAAVNPSNDETSDPVSVD